MPDSPNVVLFVADDLGYGDLGCQGNTAIRTPAIDDLAGGSTSLARFYSQPVCAPTRACMLTGRHHYRTGVTDTYLGRAMMHGDETTLPEVLSAAGYRTGIVGKWHLGDCYPMRPSDQGFDEALVHRGGGIGQPGDLPGNTYFDPTLVRDGDPEPREGYCTDTYVDEALEFVRGSEPFLLIVATNCPHTPLQVPEGYAEPYREMGLADPVARFYGMVENIDDNVARLREGLAAAGMAEDTLFAFTSDNGPQPLGDGPRRFTAGLRGAKGDPYEGGVRVPCFVRWPGELEDGTVDRPAGFVDLLPTLADIAGVEAPPDLDGESLVPLFEGREPDWAGRHLFVQWHRGDEPDLHRNAAVVGDRFKLVNGTELYDIEEDPGETTDLAARRPELVTEFRESYEAWFADVAAERGFEPPRIVVGSSAEPRTLLTRQDWRGDARDGWSDGDVGHWLIEVAGGGDYDVTVRVPEDRRSTVRLRVGDAERALTVARGIGERTFEAVALDPGPAKLETWSVADGDRRGVRSVEVARSGD